MAARPTAWRSIQSPAAVVLAVVDLPLQPPLSPDTNCSSNALCNSPPLQTDSSSNPRSSPLTAPSESPANPPAVWRCHHTEPRYQTCCSPYLFSSSARAPSLDRGPNGDWTPCSRYRGGGDGDCWSAHRPSSRRPRMGRLSSTSCGASGRGGCSWKKSRH